MDVRHSHGKVPDGGMTVMAMYRMLFGQSLKGTGWWSYSHGNVQDGGLTVIARYRIVI